MQESISGGKIWSRKSMPVKEKQFLGLIMRERYFTFLGTLLASCLEFMPTLVNPKISKQKHTPDSMAIGISN